MATLPLQSPLHIWCIILTLTITTLNLLCPSLINPRLPEEETPNGTFNYNKTPVAPPGTKVVVHGKPNNRKTWDPPWIRRMLHSNSTIILKVSLRVHPEKKSRVDSQKQSNDLPTTEAYQKLPSLKIPENCSYHQTSPTSKKSLTHYCNKKYQWTTP